jgi:hypothetical protein
VLTYEDDRHQGSESERLIVGHQSGNEGKSHSPVEGDHNIDCRIDGIGEMKLKSEFVKKA